MKNSFRSIILVATLCTVVWALAFSAGASAAEPSAGRNFLRDCLAPGVITARVSGNASLELVTDNESTSMPINLVQGQAISGELQVPFAGGGYTVKLVQLGASGERDVIRVRGTLIAKGPGAYEHQSMETLADPESLAFSQNGTALFIEAGSIRGSAVLSLLATTNAPLRASIALDSDGSGDITDLDVHKEEVVYGPQATIETPSIEGLPLTSRIRAEVWDQDQNSKVMRIEGPFDLLTMRASAQPTQELSQDRIKSCLVYIKRVPFLTTIQIPASRLSPPAEVVVIQPQSPAQNTRQPSAIPKA